MLVPTLKDIIRYVVEGVAIAAAATIIPRKPLSSRVIFMAGVLGAVVFYLLDVFASPSVAFGARIGTGIKLGMSMVGGRSAVGARTVVALTTPKPPSKVTRSSTSSV